jgi:hypothetical protein
MEISILYQVHMTEKVEMKIVGICTFDSTGDRLRVV